MRFYLVLIVTFLISLSATANLVCTNPTTSFYLQNGELLVNSPYGPQYTPIFDGQVPPFALEQMKIDAAAALKFGTQIKVKFNNCQQDEMLILCQDGTFEGQKATNVRFRTAVVTEKALNYSYDHLKTILLFSIDGQSFSISSRYNPTVCVF